MSLNGFTRSIETESGQTLPAAYYKVGHIQLSNEIVPKRVVFNMNVYVSKAAFDALKRPIQDAGLDTSYLVQGADFDTWFKDSVLLEEGKSLLSQAYLYAKDKINDPNIVDIEDPE